MDHGKNRGVLGSDCRKFMNVKEATIVDFLGGYPPVGQSIGLIREQSIQWRKTSGITLRAIEKPDILFDKGANLWASQGSSYLANDLVIHMSYG